MTALGSDFQIFTTLPPAPAIQTEEGLSPQSEQQVCSCGKHALALQQRAGQPCLALLTLPHLQVVRRSESLRACEVISAVWSPPAEHAQRLPRCRSLQSVRQAPLSRRENGVLRGRLELTCMLCW